MTNIITKMINDKIIMLLITIVFILICTKTSIFEGLTSVSNEAVQNLGSVYNSSLITATNLNVSGQVNFLPKGIIVAWSGTTVPTGWILCDGTNGSPDLRDKFILGAGTTYQPNSTGGEINHTLTSDEIPSHSHATIDDRFNYASGNNFFGDGSKNLSGGGSWSWGVGGNRFYTSNVGGSKPHNNMPPYFTLAYIMRNV